MEQIKKEINLEELKNNPKLISLMEKLRTYKINIDDLNDSDVTSLIKCILITSR